MNIKVLFYFVGVLCGISMSFKDAQAVVGALSPQDFNKMYYLAAQGKVGILRNAVNRGLNIDSVNPNGDTGLCIAIKRNNYVAYNSFRMSGANPSHPCTFRMYNHYQRFLKSTKTVRENVVLGNEESLYYREEEKNWWPWILGGLVVGGGISAMSGGGGGSPVLPDDSILPTPVTDGLGVVIDNYTKLYSGGKLENTIALNASNPNASTVVDKIQFLPNIMDNASYLNSFIKLTNNAAFTNKVGGSIILGDRTVGTSGDGAIGIAATEGSKAKNEGYIKVEAFNGAIGMVASGNDSLVKNSKDNIKDNSSNGKIDLIFRGDRDGDTIIGMYADTEGSAINDGVISGTTTQTSKVTQGIVSDLIGSDETEGTDGAEGSSDETSGDTDTSERGEDTEKEKEDVKANSGTIIGMALYDFYTATDFSNREVYATNNGIIDLKAGYNAATDASVSLIGMGSYIDDRFLQGNNSPFYAEKMVLTNRGDINLSYQGKYTLNNTALKLGNGGMIGMRADAHSEATNSGNIMVDLSATTLEKGVDVAAGMLSVHGAKLQNGKFIEIKNEASSGGVAYGMLATKGDGAQTQIYKWQEPEVTNNGVINMNVSNSYAMASFAGGKIVNNGTINLGVERGESYYTGNYGMYAGGASTNEHVTLVNNGTINVNSKESVAMQNDFAGSAEIENNGTIYVSHKAVTETPESFVSNVFKGKFSKATNNGTIDYRVGNTLGEFTIPSGGRDAFGINIVQDFYPFASVIHLSAESNVYNQEFVNHGEISIGEAWESMASDENKDYGGTYSTVGVRVSDGSTAFNYGSIILKKYEDDVAQFNTGMWLDDRAAAEARVENYGIIDVSATNSVGIRNYSLYNALARNLGIIEVDGAYSYAMAARGNAGTQIINGKNNDAELNKKSNIYLSGANTVGMFVQKSKGINYGTIYLNNNSTTAVQLSGEGAVFENYGDFKLGSKDFSDVVFYWLSGDASKSFNSKDGGEIEGYTLAKLTTSEGIGSAIFSKDFSATVSGSNSHLSVVDGGGSVAENYGNIVVNDAVGVVVNNGGLFRNNASNAKIEITDSKGIGVSASGIGSTVQNYGGAKINVSKGTGIYADEFAIVDSNSEIMVSDGGVGIEVRDSSNDDKTTAKNSGSINVEGNNSIGIKSVGALVENKGTITVGSNENEEKSVGVYVKQGFLDNNGIVNVMGKGVVGIKLEEAREKDIQTVGLGGTINVYSEGGIGIYNSNSNITNAAEVNVSQKEAIGYYVDTIYTLKDSATYTVNNGGIGVNIVKGKIEGSGKVNVYNKLFDETDTVGVLVGGGEESAIYDNYGDITVNSGIGVKVIGNGKASNLNKITVIGGTGMYVSGGEGYNKSSIDVKSGAGIYVDEGGTGYNTDKITVESGYGMSIGSGGTGHNTGTITVKGGTGMNIASGGIGYNHNLITVEKGTGMNIQDGGKGYNYGEIQYKSKNNANAYIASGEFNNTGVITDLDAEDKEADGAKTLLSDNASIVDLIVLGDGASFVNKGVVELEDVDVNFDDAKNNNASFEVGKGGSYVATSFSGDVEVSDDVVKGGFEDVYINKDSFVGKNEGVNVSSKSYMFNAKTNVNGDVTDVELNRKSFEELVEEKDLADFFEINYNLGNNERLYDSLKSASNSEEFDRVVESETGKKFYANLARENVAVLRGLSTTQQNRILQDGISEKSVGANVFVTGKDGVDGLSGYEDNIYSAYIGFGKKLNSNWNIGATFTAGYVDSSYDDINSEKENKILMAFMPILYKNNSFKYLANPHIGFGLGRYNRRANSGNYEADTFDIYYGMTNHAEYSVDVKVAELVYEAELNLHGVKSDDMKEKGGFILNSNDTVSLEAGVGIKLRKMIDLGRNRSLMLAVGSKYYQELLDPYENLNVTMKGSPVGIRYDGYDEDDKRIKTTFEALYKDGEMNVGAEISHNKEKQSSVEGAIGVRYNF